MDRKWNGYDEKNISLATSRFLCKFVKFCSFVFFTFLRCLKLFRRPRLCSSLVLGVIYNVYNALAIVSRDRGVASLADKADIETMCCSRDSSFLCLCHNPAVLSLRHTHQALPPHSFITLSLQRDKGVVPCLIVPKEQGS